MKKFKIEALKKKAELGDELLDDMNEKDINEAMETTDKVDYFRKTAAFME